MSTPALWLPEACYQRLRDRLRSKKTLTPAEMVKLAEAEFRLGNHQAARQEAQRLLKSNPRSEWGLYWLSRSSSELAEDCFSKVASLSPESARVHQILGSYFSERHNFPRARREYEAAIQLAPNLPDLHLGLAEAYWLDRRWPEAEKEFERTLELAPGSAVAEYELGDALLKELRWQPAMEHLRRALSDPSLALKVRLDLSKAEAEMGQTRQAVEELLHVAEADKDGEVHYRLAGLYRKLGEKTLATEALATFQRLRSASVQASRSDLEALEKERERSSESRTPESRR
jgi:tetratricopeptide (TPR) repeat protein